LTRAERLKTFSRARIETGTSIKSYPTTRRYLASSNKPTCENSSDRPRRLRTSSCAPIVPQEVWTRRASSTSFFSTFREIRASTCVESDEPRAELWAKVASLSSCSEDKFAWREKSCEETTEAIQSRRRRQIFRCSFINKPSVRLRASPRALTVSSST